MPSPIHPPAPSSPETADSGTGALERGQWYQRELATGGAHAFGFFSQIRGDDTLYGRRQVDVLVEVVDELYSSYLNASGPKNGRVRLVAKERPLILTSPILDRPTWLNSFFHPCFCFRDGNVEMNGEGTSYGAEAMNHQRAYPLPRTRQGLQWGLGLRHFLQRLFCLRCSVAEQTRLLFVEEERRGYAPRRFCCEEFFGSAGYMPRTFWTMCICDVLTVGCPCGCCYHGLGATLYGCRLRYLLRCRYRVRGTAFGDCCTMLWCPLFAVDQQGLEMASHGLHERHRVGRVML